MAGADAEASAAPLFVSITKIAPNPSQPRKTFRASELSELAGSIREQGILQPLVVRRRGDGYELIIGERRWRAIDQSQRAAALPQHFMRPEDHLGGRLAILIGQQADRLAVRPAARRAGLFAGERHCILQIRLRRPFAGPDMDRTFPHDLPADREDPAFAVPHPAFAIGESR